MKEHRLLIMAIGPVQAFIAAARRCQDMWSGSQLLSDVAGAMAGALQTNGLELIYPASVAKTEDGKRHRSNPNIMLASAAGVADQEVRELADLAIKAGIDTLRARIGDLRERIKTQGVDLIDWALLEQQVLGVGGETGMLEWHWAIGEGATYGEARAQATALLQARKQTRTWSATTVSTSVAQRFKSTIDGTRESVIPPRSRAVDAALRDALRMRPKEVLAGPGLLKRGRQMRGVDAELPDIHSTSHMAAVPLLTRLARADANDNIAGLRDPVADWLEALSDLMEEAFEDAPNRDQRSLRGEAGIARMPDAHAILPETDERPAIPVNRNFTWRRGGKALAFDGSVFFPGRVDELFEIGDASEPGGRTRQRAFAAKAQRKLRTCLQALGLGDQPTPYYAMLAADGDRVGAYLRQIAENGGDAASHRAFSVAMESEFAERCDRIVADHGGSLIYAGGDDVLALLPLHTAVEACQALQAQFTEAMRPLASPAGVKRPTLSAGLAFVHHLTPLDIAATLAHAAEGIAKNGLPESPGGAPPGQRDALAIIMDKRSGTRVAITGPWTGDDALPERLRDWIDALEGGHLPDGVAYELETVCRPFEMGDGTGASTLRRLAERIIGRKKNARAEGLSQVIQDRLLGRVDGQGVAGVRHLSHELQVARLICRARADAQPTTQEVQHA